MTRPMEWLAALRDHPDRPPVTQRMVLVSLALRTDWSAGSGFASTGQLAADTDCDERTVRRATEWARGAGMLIRARRGHRLGDGRKVASEWRLTVPQPDTGDPLSGISTGQDPDLNRTGRPSQPDSTTPPSRPSSSRTRSSAFVGAASARPTQAPRPQPCPECGEGFTPEDLADPGNRRRAEDGDLWHDKCLKAYMVGDECRGAYASEQEWRDEYRAMWGAEP